MSSTSPYDDNDGGSSPSYDFVGGFGELPYLIRRLTEKGTANSGREELCPEQAQAQAAIVCGAVMGGLNQEGVKKACAYYSAVCVGCSSWCCHGRISYEISKNGATILAASIVELDASHGRSAGMMLSPQTPEDPARTMPSP